MVEFLQRTLDGLLQAGPYALVGLGLTLGFGVLRRVNLAYGAGAMLAAYAGAWLHARMGAPAWLVLAVLVLGTMLVGLYVEWMCFAGARRAPTPAARGLAVGGADGREVAALAASFALWMQLEQLAVTLLPRHLNPFPSLAVTAEWRLGPFGLRGDQLSMLMLAAVLVAAVAWFLQHTRAGLAWRAVADHRGAAQVVGLDVPRVQRLAFVATCGLAGIAACAVLALDGQVTPMFGMWMLVKGLVAAMLGGLGSVRGVLVGAVVLGVLEAQAQAAFGAIGRDATAWALLLGVLVWRAARGGGGSHGLAHA
ncbi:branched-chain amino acid ABC transporter permease [Aquincola sp. J276]|uniref:branched-chain amino acid ABC transporter permease n=1 Tax=Aquincola sp. J276 TaxID=2898432 RepID=UPI002151A205|nr:branched-chain amino acid ABC transporter permease [Aquincola sp. J276]MCR5864478.1 branched-chain amino acid ABC transporter permease [Aquincola sp. J276]